MAQLPIPICPPAPVPEDPDLSYRKRLLDVYIELQRTGTLVTPLPSWTETFTPADPPTERIVTLDDLCHTPRLQAAMADATAYTPSKWLLEKELEKRYAHKPPIPGQKSWQPPSTTNPHAQDVYDAADTAALHGLAFSGGGIRSATFNLGVLQALAACSRLGDFDYLSSVSGGGYIHQWLASWIGNEKGRLAAVEPRLIPLPDGVQARAPEQITWLRRYSSYLTPKGGILSADTWTLIAIWFRNTFLNQIVLISFLAFSLLVVRGISYPFFAPVALDKFIPFDTVLFVALCLWLVVSLFALGGALLSISTPAANGKPPRWAIGNAGVFFLIVLPGFLLSIFLALESADIFQISNHSAVFLVASIYLLLIVIVVSLGARSSLGTRASYIASTAPQRAAKIRSALLLAVVSVFGWALSAGIAVGFLRYAHTFTPATKSHLFAVCKYVADHINLYLGAATVATHPVTPQSLFAVFAPVCFFALEFLAIRLQIGILGRFYTESRREWLARLGAWAAILSFGWMILCGIGLLGPILYYWVFGPSTFHRLFGLLGIVLVHAVTLFSGGSSKSDGKPKPGAIFGYQPMDLVSIVGAPLCILILLILASGLVDTTIHLSSEWGFGLSHTFFLHHPSLRSTLASLYHQLPAPLQNHDTRWPIVLFVFICSILAFFGWRIDINEFSLHGFYRNRLARCYLGGNNPRRTPDPFTGFDDRTESTASGRMPLRRFLPRNFSGHHLHNPPVPGQPPPPSQPPDILFNDPPYDGPFPIFCSTVTLTFGQDLASQERKGASFAFTPLYSGYHVGWTGATGTNTHTTFNGFVPTGNYAYPDEGIQMAFATAISGAAVSPNMGYSSQPALAFLMTLFNIRLSWWIANPRRPAVWPASRRRPTPRFGLWYLLRELFGYADDTSNYISLTDGGHFENMGLYELVRRRCKFILVCDAEEDDKTVFEGIGGAIEKCRTDFGAEITLNLEPLIPNEHGLSRLHLQVGTIKYPPPPGAAERYQRELKTNPAALPKTYEGRIVYLKTSITGDETADLLHHRRSSPNFPQDSTLNQWFTESVFESYRRLGLLIGKEACHHITVDNTGIQHIDPKVGIPVVGIPVPPKTKPS